MNTRKDSAIPSFQNQVALVTGAAAGIGRATALAFAAVGAKVVVSDVDEPGGIETVRSIEKTGGEALFVACDVSRPEQVRELVARTAARFGRLDHAFNNAGIEGQPAPLMESTAQNWDKTLAVNLSGVYWCMREELSVMLKQGSGTIINCASIAGLRGFAAMGAYVASKHGVLGLTKSAALDYASRGIRINAICPGVIHTPMIDRFTRGDEAAARSLAAGAPAGRMGRPEEIADAVLWLCNPGAAFVHGAEIVVDGGWCAK
jgi:NAD(P)-dependent dehydrogenase (short-subunit alcohol dehydrogenase family)